MNSGIWQVFQREVTCPICMNYFIDPVTMGCGHSFCRPCFYLHWEDIPILTQCFECIKSTQQRNLKTNIRLKKMASFARKASLWLFLSSEEQMCGTHRETKKMFCEVDKSLLCSLCSSSQEHRDHRHCPVEWAAEEHRVKLLQKMQSLWGKARENQRNQNVETTRISHWKAFGDILYRSECVLLHMPQPLNLELRAGPITGLRNRLNQIRVDITLHHNEANSHIFRCGHLRSICIGCDHQNAPHITATPTSFLAWGAQSFTSGKYYWEAHVGDSWNWAFGVCNKYGQGKNQNGNIYGEEGLFSLGCVKNDIQCSLFTTSTITLQYVSRPTSHIGLFLDCEARTVSFVDVNQSSPIYTIPNCSFSPPLRPVFCCIHL
ncbi:E3 ubiquitin-protein ligase TRIM48-like isoform X2 [Symphalangus syndactylus]|uniref:E3 ubiquitin-protein ligase TRIM48-like isoform X2 n=1 Tax=Symphalangus syndactylus TaxID=9590 RepID=UPI0024429FA4|nr:E3 ubiquitin-protein ligase TRIM48-like isoform X2 [Symphalangus syndactylus]